MTVLEAKRSTLADVEVLMTAQNFRTVDLKFESAIKAWDNMRLKQTKKKGKKTVPLYTSFKEFFDYEKELERISEVDSEDKKVIDERMRILNRIKELNKGGEK